jgi:hypothetical protein
VALLLRRLLGLTAVVLGLTAADPAHAQTAGRASVGVAHTWIRPAHADVAPTSGFAPVARLNPGRGVGFAAALDWYDADVRDEQGHAGVIRVRPFMAGIGVGLPQGRLHTALTLVAGPSFNRLEVRDGAEADIRTSLAVRPGLSLTYAVGPRVALTGFGGSLFNRPEITYRSGGVEQRNRWTADAVILSTGVVVSLF